MNADKAEQRQIAYAARNAQAEKDVLSAAICRVIVAQPWYRAAVTVMWYIHCRSEVRTLPAVAAELASDKRIVVPYCTVDADGHKQLGLWHLQALDELQPGMWGILEPPRAKWPEPDKQIKPSQLDVVIVPGVAFDKQGGRLGNGAGYYDRLLARVSPHTVLAAVCFESQLLPAIATAAHDVAMDFVITERAVYAGRGRTSR